MSNVKSQTYIWLIVFLSIHIPYSMQHIQIKSYHVHTVLPLSQILSLLLGLFRLTLSVLGISSGIRKCLRVSNSSLFWKSQARSVEDDSMWDSGWVILGIHVQSCFRRMFLVCPIELTVPTQMCADSRKQGSKRGGQSEQWDKYNWFTQRGSSLIYLLPWSFNPPELYPLDLAVGNSLNVPEFLAAICCNKTFQTLTSAVYNNAYA